MQPSGAALQGKSQAGHGPLKDKLLEPGPVWQQVSGLEAGLESGAVSPQLAGLPGEMQLSLQVRQCCPIATSQARVSDACDIFMGRQTHDARHICSHP